MNEKANYGNWVPEKALYMLFGAVIVLGVIAVAVQVALSEMVIAIIVGVLCILTLVMAIYMLICHEAFAFGKGNMMAGVHEHLIKHLDWDGEGKLLDIGCGAALRQSISKGTDHSDGSLGCGMELCKRAVREKCKD